MAKKKATGKLMTQSVYHRRYPTAGKASSICLTEEDTLKLPSRILALNAQLGGGLFYGHIMELYGEENVGKTLLAIDFGTTAISLGGEVIWVDAESTFNGAWAMRNGLDLDKVNLLPMENKIELISDYVMDTIVMVRSRLKNNEPILLVLDSLAALECQENLETSHQESKAEMGNRAKALETFLRRRNTFFHKYGICCIFINQLRAKIGASKFEDPDTTPVGKAMKFYASQRVGAYRGKLLKDKKGKKVGRLVYVRLHKTKVSMPEENIACEVYFKEHEGKLGYSKYFGFLELLVERGILKRKKGRYYLKDKMIANGEANMQSVLENDPEIRKKLIKKAGVLTISKAREKLETLSTNLYPVSEKKIEDEDEENNE